jgi:hypothetical protein
MVLTGTKAPMYLNDVQISLKACPYICIYAFSLAYSSALFINHLQRICNAAQ